MSLRLSMIACLVGLAGLLYALPAGAAIPTMTVSELEPGMQGIGRTVIRGTEIEEFDCEIIDVFTNMGYNGGPLILMRLSGDVIDASGGIAGGYSGSPVYIDGKLIGALSWGPWFTEGDVAGATPINDMLRAFTYPDEEPPRISSEPVSLEEPLEVAGREFNRMLLADYNSSGEALEGQYGPDTLVMTPCRTPLVVSGLSQTGFDALQEFAQDRLPYMDLIQGPGSGSSQGVPILLGPTTLEPGASIGAQLASGDLDLTAVGTLTWIDDDGRFLAFGHPFFGDGVTNMPFVTTEIIYTMPALDRSYKLGEALDVVGTVTEDRLTAIGGMLREIPEMVDFHLTVIDRDIDRTERYNYSVIAKEDWLPFLGWIMPMQGLMYGSDRMGPGTCRLSFSIRGEGLSEPIERSNLVYAGWDTSEALSEFMEALSMVTMANPYREVRLTNVDIEVEITSVRQTMDIIRARFRNPPNMGPGAVGYAGPESMEDKEAKDESIGETSNWFYPMPEDLQDIPAEELEMYMSEFGEMDMYGMEGMAAGLVGYHPGDSIEVLVTLRPYREDAVEEVIELEIPMDFPPGQTTLEIMGGTTAYYYGSMMYYADPMMGGYYYGADMYSPPSDLDAVIDEFMARDVGNSIIVRLMTLGMDDPYYYLQDEYEPPKETRASIITDDVIYGYFSLPIEILGEDVTMDMDGEFLEEDYMDMMEPVVEQDQAPGSRNPHRQ